MLTLQLSAEAVAARVSALPTPAGLARVGIDGTGLTRLCRAKGGLPPPPP